MASLIETRHYPVNAKYHMKLEGLNIGLFSRSNNSSGFSELYRLEVEELYELEKAVSMYLKRT